MATGPGDDLRAGTIASLDAPPSPWYHALDAAPRRRTSPVTTRGRDPRFTVRIGEPPAVGRRYVENGRVRIEWTEAGRRRRKTIGDNDRATRAAADAELAGILEALSGESPTPSVGNRAPDPEGAGRTVRAVLLRVLDAGDALAEAIRDAGRSPEQP